MKLQGRNLSFGMQGEDIKLLHGELKLLDYLIPDGELKEARFGEKTREAVISFQKTNGLEPTGAVDKVTAHAINARIDAIRPRFVRGQVKHPDGSAAAGVLVRAFDKDMRSEEMLGEARTEEDGRYEIGYNGEKFRRAEKGSADLRVAACNEDGRELASSAVVFNAGDDETVDLVLPGERQTLSEYERYLKEIEPVLQGVPLHELTEEDVTFLNNDTGIERQHIIWLRESAKLVKETKLAASEIHTHVAHMHLPAAVFYGWLRQNLPADLDELGKQSEDALQHSFDKALLEDIIPAQLKALKEDIFVQWKELRARHMLKPAPEGTQASLGDLLNTMPTPLKLDSAQAKVVSEVLLSSTFEREKCAERFKQAGLEAGQINSVLRAYGLSDLTLGHLPLIAQLQSDALDEHAADLEDLAALGREEWKKLAKKSGVPVNKGFPEGEHGLNAYVDHLIHGIELRQPTAYLAARVADNRIRVNEKAKGPLIEFFKSNRTFRFCEDSVVAYFLDEKRADFKEIAEDLLPAVQEELMRIERVARMTPLLEQAEQLLSFGYGSAHQIVRKSEDVFIKEVKDKLAGGEATAKRIYSNAKGVTAATAGVLLAHAPRFKRHDLPVVHSGNPQPVTLKKSARRLPVRLEELFGSLDCCECTECVSMFSPAAYFVDLLHMLDGGMRNMAGESALDVLLKRRPDFAEIDLTCDNTKTTLPYIDLVLEALETSLISAAYWNRFARGLRDAGGSVTTAWQFDADLDRGVMPQQLNDDLKNAGIDLGGSIAITKIQVPQGRWLVRGENWKIYLRGLQPYAYRVEIIPQTFRQRQDSAAFPSTFVYWGYEALKTASFPWVLPFDLTREETNAWLDHLGVSRHRVIEAFSGTQALQSEDAACELLGLSTAEKTILVTAAAAPYKDWGFDSAMVFDPTMNGNVDWSTRLRSVPEFRRRARLSHRELLQLLETRFIQGSPGLSSRLELSGDECDGGKMRLGDTLSGGLLTPSVLRRFHLFVRLWRKLEWSVFDLDRAIAAFSVATIPPQSTPFAVSSAEHYTPDFLVFLANIERLKAVTGLSVETLLNLYRAKLDTNLYWDHSGHQPRREFSFYEKRYHDSALVKPIAPEFELNDQRDELLKAAAGEGLPRLRLSDHAPVIAAALSCNVKDVFALLPSGQASLSPMEVTQSIDGEAIQIAASQGAVIEIIVGKPSGQGASIVLRIQDSQDGTAFSDVTPSALDGQQQPQDINAGNSWKLLRLRYTGNRQYIRVSVAEVHGTDPKCWISARVLESQGIIEDELSLDNLSMLTRSVLLARGLRMQIDEFGGFIEISGLDPFSSPAQTLEFQAAYKRNQLIGLGVAELGYLLRHRFPSETARIENEKNITGILTSIRARLKSTKSDLSPAPGRSTDLVRRLLLEIGWPARLVEVLMSAEHLAAERAVYGSELEVASNSKLAELLLLLPAGFDYDSVSKRLIWSGRLRKKALDDAIDSLRSMPSYLSLNSAEKQALDGAVNNVYSDFQNKTQVRADRALALAALTRSLTLPVHSAAYVPAHDESLTVPKNWTGIFWYEPSTKMLKFSGPMPEKWKEELKQLSARQSFKDAVDQLYTVAQSYTEAAAANAFIFQESRNPSAGGLTAESLTFDLGSMEDRCEEILRILGPYVLKRRAWDVVAGELAAGLGLESGHAGGLLKHYHHDGQPLLEGTFLQPAFLSSDAASEMTRSGFAAQFEAMDRLTKFALISRHANLSAKGISWLFGAWKQGGGLVDLSILTIQKVDGPAPLWAKWDELVILFSLGVSPNGSPDIEAVRDAVMAQDRQRQLNMVAMALGTDVAEFEEILDALGFSVAQNLAALLEPSKLAQLHKFLEILRQLGATARVAIGWKPHAVSGKAATDVRRLARARAGDSAWPDASHPVTDALRLRRRDALVEYYVSKEGLRDANDLYGQLLIDPQMGPCMKTSRIRQAIGSVQLFIHRCLMNLEGDASPDMIDKKTWEWMKNYRVWEANRKVLLYPENWIEPELRDDKTPFFKDLESELLQGDIDQSKAESGIYRYLDRLNDISRLEIVGFYRDTDDSGRVSLHVVGRGHSEPKKYYYRKYSETAPEMVGCQWTPWVPIDLDIEGDHILPVVWQKRLFLFWALFKEEPVEELSVPASPRLPRKRYQLQLAWSEFKDNKWGTRNISGKLLERIVGSEFDYPEVGRLNNAFKAVYDFIYLKSRLNDVVFYVNDSSAEFRTLVNTIEYNSADPVGTVTGNKQLPFIVARFDGHRVEILQRLRITGGYGEFYNGPPLQVEVAQVGAGQPAFDQNNPQPAACLHFNQMIRSEVRAGRDYYLHLAADRPVNSASISGSYLRVPPEAGRLRVVNHGAQEPKQYAFSGDMSTLHSTNGLRSILFLSDASRCFFVFPKAEDNWQWNGAAWEKAGLVFSSAIYSFDFLHSKRFLNLLKDGGVHALLSQEKGQNEPEFPAGLKGSFCGPDRYASLGEIKQRFLCRIPGDDIPFLSDEPYCQYSWELFFHLPFTVACQLVKNQHFAEARRWFHFIFDPTDNSSSSKPQRYWRFRPFSEIGQGTPVTELIRKLADKNDHSEEKKNFQNLVELWKTNPFQPHLVARMRPRSYMYAVVMKYLDNLIAWGDQLFRRDTMESLNEAAQIYILAAQIIGTRPKSIPRRTRPQTKAFSELRNDLDDLSNALVAAENVIPPSNGASGSGTPALPIGPSLYFCVPENSKLAEYYDKVDDRLFNLRNCRNIDGVVRQLPLFEPPIDPGLLVKAAAAGVDIGATLTDAEAPLPHYRFNVMAQKAGELCTEVKALGGALLSAIEKRDAEALSRLRAGHEIDVLEHIRRIKELQIEEAKANLDALRVSLESAQARFAYYVGLLSSVEELGIPTGSAGPTVQSLATAALETLGKATTVAQAISLTINPLAAVSLELLKKAMSRATEAINETSTRQSNTARVPMIPAEKRHLDELKSAHDLQQKAMDQRMVAQLFAKIPDITLGTQGISSPVIVAQLGGSLLSSFANFEASILDSKAGEHTYRAGLHSTLASYQRRAAEWAQLATSANHDIEQITKQIVAAGLRASIAAQDLRSHDLQNENAREVDEFMRGKFSNQELHDWMVGQISGIYFKAYHIAYDVAKRAERAYRHELGLEDSNFVQFGCWDSLKKGLLAGEKLSYDLKRMEISYLDQNKREYEITRHVSLMSVDPVALLQLKMLGQCEVSLPEELLDVDQPGGYMRRIKSVSLTIPCVVGPYTSVNCKLTLLKSVVRRKNILSNSKYERQENDSRFTEEFGAIESVITSSAQMDSGLFETNLRDERYLPFEGRGAISTWRIELPNEFRQFDYNTISDVILHIRYTAREGGDLLQKAAVRHLGDYIKDAQAGGTVRLFSIRHDFPTEWAKFKNTKIDLTATPKVLAGLTVTLKPEHYPFWAQGRLGKVKSVEVFAKTSKNVTISNDAGKDTLDIPFGGLIKGTLANTKPKSPTDPFSLYFDDKSMEELWLAVAWGKTS